MTVSHSRLFRSALLGGAAVCLLACGSSSSDGGGSSGSSATGAGGSGGTGGGASSAGGATTGSSSGGASSSAGGNATSSGGSGASSASAGGSAGSAGSGGTDSGAGGAGGVMMIPGEYEPCSGEAPPELTLTGVTSIEGQPIFVTAPRDAASTMIFIVQREGSIFSFDMANPSGAPQQVLESLNADVSSERGLLSMALHPDFDGTTNTRFFIYWTGDGPNQSMLDEYSMSGGSATFVANLFTYEQPASNHNGGTVVFGPDGYLYLGLGDGGDANDQHTNSDDNNAQNTAVPLGKMLRFDVDNPTASVSGNLTSADVGGAEVEPHVLHWGIRNPYRYSFDRATNDLYIGDVGQNDWEEVDFIPAGSAPQNLGWAALEGEVACPGCSGVTATDDMLGPIHVWANPGFGAGGACVIGGYVYRGTQIPGLRGRYIFADHNMNTVSLLTKDPSGDICDLVDITDNLGNIDRVVSFGEDSQGELYLMMEENGAVYRIEAE